MYKYINLESIEMSQHHASMNHNFSNDADNNRLIAFVASKLEEIVSWSKGSPGLNAGINVGIRIGAVDSVLRRCNPQQIDDVTPLVQKINDVVNSMFDKVEP